MLMDAAYITKYLRNDIMKKTVIASAMGALLMISSQAVLADVGKATYDKACFACHALGIAGAPKLGDKDAWTSRIAQGMDVMVRHSIEGFTGSTGFMPPKGGRVDLSDDEVKAAVVYMVEQSQ